MASVMVPCRVYPGTSVPRPASEQGADKIGTGGSTLVASKLVKQTRGWSMVETVVGTAIGMVVALAMQYAVLPHYGLPAIGFFEHFQITLWFTIASIVRGYAVRRLFNWAPWHGALAPRGHK